MSKDEVISRDDVLKIVDDLKAGYGVEDICVRRGIPEREVRRIIGIGRRTGGIWRMCGTTYDGNMAARRIMCV